MATELSAFPLVVPDPATMAMRLATDLVVLRDDERPRSDERRPGP